MNDDAATYTSMYNNDNLDFSLTFVDKPFYLGDGIGELDGYNAYLTPGPTKNSFLIMYRHRAFTIQIGPSNDQSSSKNDEKNWFQHFTKKHGVGKMRDIILAALKQYIDEHDIEFFMTNDM